MFNDSRFLQGSSELVWWVFLDSSFGLNEEKDRDWVLSSFSKKTMTLRPCSEASRNQIQNKQKEVISEDSRDLWDSLTKVVMDPNSLYSLKGELKQLGR